MAIKELSDGGPEGTRLGQTAADLLAMWGASPQARIDYSSAFSATSVTSLAPLSGGSNYGFSSSAQVAQVENFLSAVRETFVRLGVWPTTS
jgi:hypothetical protein